MESTQTELSTNVDQIVNKKEAEKRKYNKMVGIYILGISGIAAGLAGIITTRIAKRKGSEYLKELGREEKIVMESPHSLAFRALAWGTVWAVGVCSLSVFGIWKWFGIKDMDDLRARLRKQMKKSTKESEGRTEFENVTDLLTYLNETYSSKPGDKKSEKGS